MPQAFPLRLLVEGYSADAHRLPIRLYGHILNHFQDVIYLIGASVEGMNLSSRGPLPSAIVNTYSLEVTAESKGSFVVELEFADMEQLPVYEQSRHQVVSSFEDVLESVASRDAQRLYSAIPNSRLRRRILRGLNEVVSPGDPRYKVSFATESNSRIWTIDDDSRQWMAQTLRRTSWTQQQEMWGRIIELRVVNELRFVIMSRGTEVKCYFEEDLLDEVVEHTGNLVRVSGEAIYTDRGLDRYHVHSLEPLAPGNTSISVVQIGNHRYELSDPIEAELTYDDAEELWELRVPDLRISAVGSDVSHVLHEFSQDFDMLWREYALSGDGELTESGQKLKDYLTEIVAVANVEE